MITAEEVKEYFDKIKDNPEEVNKFLTSIGVKEDKPSYPRVPSTFTIESVDYSYRFSTGDISLFTDEVVRLCNNHKHTFSYQTSCVVPWIDSTSEESSIRETVNAYINDFFSRTSTALNMRGGICKNNVIHCEVYASNEYTHNLDRFHKATRRKAVHIEGLSLDFVQTAIDKTVLSGYTKEQFRTYIDNSDFYTEVEQKFIEFLYSVYKAPCCYPHEAKATAVLD
jgi:hypothetical protein